MHWDRNVNTQPDNARFREGPNMLYSTWARPKVQLTVRRPTVMSRVAPQFDIPALPRGVARCHPIVRQPLAIGLACRSVPIASHIDPLLISHPPGGAIYTSPPIRVAQARNDAVRMVGAQARLYADVKTAQWLRLALVVSVGLAISIACLVTGSEGSVGWVSGVLLLFLNAAFMYRERRRVALAVSIQEAFDCQVFGLEWNDTAVRDRPPGQEIAKAAARYTGSRDQNWYPNTGSVRRPLDVAICQQSNVGWGAPVHRAWAWSLVCASFILGVAIVATWLVSGLGFSAGAGAFVAPFLPLAWELTEIIRQNFESAAEKETTQRVILDDWANAVAGAVPLQESRCRRYQDAIAGIRKRNAQVPDWFDNRLRSRNERAMRTTAQDMVSEASRAGLA
ncbi:S-4TM family putative pore-forming effector [Williamsia herbipolensis]|uniref:S-4TM family putative pore-forming effector n=1 Tax=Williamsia herbipolensis TaxID=1603258 RepID=UPI0038B4FC50